MANQIHINEFLSKDELFASCSESIFNDIEKSFDQNDLCNILLSGGSTPEPLYKLLATNKDLVSKVQYGLVDERFVELSSDYCNEKMIRQALGSEASLIGMVADDENYERNLIEINNRYTTFLNRTDIIILGMGPDGHFASLFPNDDLSENILNSSEKGICNTNAPSFPNKRITYSFQSILEGKIIYLIITGKNKKEVLENYNLDLPIHKLLVKRNDIKIYYAD
jgi:6-phosphogluconolactonase